MTRIALFTRAARGDVVRAADWYEAQRPGLGLRFRDELEVVIEKVSDHPLHFPALRRSGAIRKAPLRHFPYLVVFEVSKDDVLVIAVFHAIRHSKVWRSRPSRRRPT